LVQLRKYPEIVRRRQENARYYDQQLRGTPGLELPPLVEGATYSHYVVRVPDRRTVMEAMRRQGVQLGNLIQYSVPHIAVYTQYAMGRSFRNSWLCSQNIINLPVHAHLTERQRAQVVELLRATF
jgi:dTDP-4-amino-4,6-dideoxygalactose transaminase